MNQSVQELLPYLRELAFSVGFLSGCVAGLLGGIYWRS